MFLALVYCGSLPCFRSAFIFRNQKQKTSIKAFFRPLDSGVWICTLISIVLLVVLLRVAFKIERILKNRSENSWMFLILTTIGTFCQQGVIKFNMYQYILVYCFRFLAKFCDVFRKNRNTIHTHTIDAYLPILFSKYRVVPFN